MITDTERLDFIEKNNLSIYRIYSEVKKYNTLTWSDGNRDYDLVRKNVGWSVSNRMDETETLREAIDAAIKEKE